MKFHIILIVSALFLLTAVSCKKDDANPIVPPEAPESFLNGTWKGQTASENRSVNLVANLTENFQNVTGNGTVKFLVSGDLSTLSIEYTNDVSEGKLINGQLGFKIKSPADGSYLIYNGGLSKTDSNVFNGNALYFNELDSADYSMPLDLVKQ